MTNVSNGIAPRRSRTRHRDTSCRQAHLLLFLLLTACGGTGDPGPGQAEDIEHGAASQPPTTEPRSRTPEPSLIDDGWVTGHVEGGAEIDGAALLTGVRVAENEGYERLVLEFEGAELPSYRIEYVDRAVYQCGSGEPVEVEGEGWLLINLQPTNAHTDEGVPTITERTSRPGLPIIRELRMICDFEAMVEWVVGVSSPAAFRVLELTGPTRLVVDLRG